MKQISPGSQACNKREANADDRNRKNLACAHRIFPLSVEQKRRCGREDLEREREGERGERQAIDGEQRVVCGPMSR